MNRKFPFIASLILLSMFMLFVSGCSVSQTLTINRDGSGSITMYADADDFTRKAFEDLAIVGGYENAEVFYSEAAKQSEATLLQRPDIKYCSVEPLKGKGSKLWQAKMDFDSISLLLGGTGGIAEVTENDSTTNLSLKFNRDNAAFAERFFPILANPAFSIFNPADTQGMTKKYYVDEVLGFTFGQENIQAIMDSDFILNIIVPGTITYIRNGKKLSDNQAVFKVPLTDIMVPENETFWSITWKDAE